MKVRISGVFPMGWFGGLSRGRALVAWIGPQLMSWEIMSIFGRRKPNLGEQRLGQGTLGQVKSRIGVENGQF